MLWMLERTLHLVEAYKVTFHCILYKDMLSLLSTVTGAQWLSGRVLDLRQRGCGFEPHRRRCVVVLEQDTFILA